MGNDFNWSLDNIYIYICMYDLCALLIRYFSRCGPADKTYINICLPSRRSNSFRNRNGLPIHDLCPLFLLLRPGVLYGVSRSLQLYRFFGAPRVQYVSDQAKRDNSKTEKNRNGHVMGPASGAIHVDTSCLVCCVHALRYVVFFAGY